MTNVEDSVIARLQKEGKTFEILVDCEKAIELKQGKEVDINDVVVTFDIFSDIKKGEHASGIESVFGTDDKVEITKEIIKKGIVQLTTEYKTKLREEKRKQIINIVHRNGIDPKNNLPHPPARIERAMDEAKVKIDEFKSADEQVQDVLDKLKSIIPIKFEMRDIQLIIPAQYSGLSYGPVKKYGKILKEEWQDNGNLIFVVEIPAGIEQDMYDELNKVTHGELEANVLEKK
jgi:ribosome maturation protein SDO1